MNMTLTPWKAKMDNREKSTAKIESTICENCGEQMLGPVEDIGYYCPNAFACGNVKHINQKTQ